MTPEKIGPGDDYMLLIALKSSGLSLLSDTGHVALYLGPSAKKRVAPSYQSAHGYR
jgi:hypothetical protein